MSAKPAPPLNAPASSTTVKISAIDTTWRMSGSFGDMMWTKVNGFAKNTFLTWSFLIEHPSGRKLLYDLGVRKDWQNLPPAHGVQHIIDSDMCHEFKVSDDVANILKTNGVNLEDVEGIIWSHWHFDHVGDPSTFPSNAKLIVGPGFKEVFLPGYPKDPDGHALESDFAGREVMEIDFSTSDITIGRFKAHDYFGDGSFYILDAPGHAIGHINALARTNASPEPAFIHLGGDSIHHLGEIRPSEYLPLPDAIKPSPIPDLHAESCPGHIFSSVLRDGSKTRSIMDWVDGFKGTVDPKYGLIYNDEDNRDTVNKDEELDANNDIFTIIAHDTPLKDIIDEYPKDLNDWKAKGWREESMWKFLHDFRGGVNS